MRVLLRAVQAIFAYPDRYLLCVETSDGRFENNGKGQVTRYNLAYINHDLYQRDNGRVIGYDNAHGVHHRHRMGVVEPVEFTNFDDIDARFQQDWQALLGKK